MNRLLLFCLSSIYIFAYPQYSYAQPSEKERIEIISTIARDFHEKEQAKSGNNNTVPNEGEFSPGKYEIDWMGAQLSQNDNLFCINIPITPQYSYQAYRTNERGKEYVVGIMQRLIVYKNKESGKMYERIHTMIPTKRVSKSWYSSYLHPGLENKITPYSGLVIFSNSTTGKTLQIITYVDGRWVDNISIPSKSNPSYDSNIKKAEELFSTIDIRRNDK